MAKYLSILFLFLSLSVYSEEIIIKDRVGLKNFLSYYCGYLDGRLYHEGEKTLVALGHITILNECKTGYLKINKNSTVEQVDKYIAYLTNHVFNSGSKK